MSNAVSPLVSSIPSFPTTAEIVANVQAVVQELNSLATNFNAGGVTQTYIEALAIALGSDASTLSGSNVQGAYELLNIARKAAFAATATGNYLDLKAADVGIYRKTATYASVSCIFTSPTVAGAGGIAIPVGTIVQAQSADPTAYATLFQVITAGSIAAGQTVSGTVYCQAVNAGSAGNVAAGLITQVVSGVTSLTVTNPAAATGGADAEGDDSPNGGLRYRTLQAIPNASQCTATALEAAALTYSGITSSTYVDLVLPDGVTFALGHGVVFCDDGTGNLGSSSDANNASLLAFQADLNAGKWKAAGVTIAAVGSTLLAVTITMSVDVASSYLLTGATTATALAAVQAAVYGYVQDLPLGAPVVVASIIQTALGVAGISNVIVSSVQINGANADLQGTASQVARCAALGSVTVSLNATTSYA